MSVPTCPPDYTCTFTPHPAPHVFDPWWTGEAGMWVGLTVIVALVLMVRVLGSVLAGVLEARRNTKRMREARVHEEQEREKERVYGLAMAEQFTMALDAAKGSPEMLKIVEDRMVR